MFFFSMAVGGGQRREGELIEASLTFESWVKKINVPSLPLLYQLLNPAAHRPAYGRSLNNYLCNATKHTSK